MCNSRWNGEVLLMFIMDSPFHYEAGTQHDAESKRTVRAVAGIEDTPPPPWVALPLPLPLPSLPPTSVPTILSLPL